MCCKWSACSWIFWTSFDVEFQFSWNSFLSDAIKYSHLEDQICSLNRDNCWNRFYKTCQLIEFLKFLLYKEPLPSGCPPSRDTSCKSAVHNRNTSKRAFLWSHFQTLYLCKVMKFWCVVDTVCCDCSSQRLQVFLLGHAFLSCFFQTYILYILCYTFILRKQRIFWWARALGSRLCSWTWCRCIPAASAAHQ